MGRGRREKKLPLVKRSALVAVLGASLRTIANLEAANVLVPKRRGKGGRPSLYDLTVVVPAYIAHVTAASPAMGDKDARTRRDLAQAKFTELKIARESGELVELADVEATGQAYTKSWAASVRGLPRRLANAGVITRDQEGAAATVCRDLLTDISRWSSMVDLKQALQQTPDGPTA